MQFNKENNDDNSLAIYMKAAGETGLLSKEEELSLFKCLNSKIKEEEKDKIRERIIKSNLKLVIKIAKEYRNLGLDYEDLIEEGNLGLMTAVDKFNPEKGTKLSYYASFWIKQSIRRAISNKGRTIRLPVAVVESKLKISKYTEEYESLNNREPSNKEIADATGLTHKKVELLTSINLQSESLNKTITNTSDGGEEDELQSLISDTSLKTPAQILLKKDGQEMLMSLVNKLEKRQRYIIIHRFGLNNTERLTLENIGKEFNLTRERIRQLELSALESLKLMISDINEI
tara:strand:- start:2079 stop:2942 length:864 start_codon:yes stop_codon:yes gene_type:complete